MLGIFVITNPISERYFSRPSNTFNVFVNIQEDAHQTKVSQHLFVSTLSEKDSVER